MADNTGCFVRTTNFFQAFTIDSTHKGKMFHALSFVNKQTGFVSCTYAIGGMLTSIDGGLSWNELPFSNQVNSPGNVLYFLKPDTGFVASNSMYAGLRRTSNGGKYWSDPPILNFECPSIFRVHFINDSTGYILSSDNPSPPTGFGELHIFKSMDYGSSWADINKLTFPQFPMGIGDIQFIDDTTAILVVENVILKSTNSCLSFDTVMVSNYQYDYLAQGMHAISFPNRDTGFVAYPTGVYKTYNAGDSWVKTDFAFDNTDFSTNAIWFVRALTGSKVVLGCQKGTVFKTETGGGVWSGVKAVEQNDFILSPNPTNDLLTIETGTSKDLKASIYSVDGRLLKSNIALQQKTQLDVFFLTPGIYFLEVMDSEQRSVKRFVKQ